MIMAHKKKKRWIIFLIVLLLVIVFIFPILNLVGDYFIVPDSLQKSDLITAVSGPEYRIVYAAELYTKGLGKTLFFTGGYSEENQRYEAAWSKYLATINGVPEEAIQTNDAMVISTYQEAVELKNLLMHIRKTITRS
jgi:hypothetical protein